MTGFEPATSGSQSRRSARLSYIPGTHSGGSLEVTSKRVNERARQSRESVGQFAIEPSHRHVSNRLTSHVSTSWGRCVLVKNEHQLLGHGTR